MESTLNTNIRLHSLGGGGWGRSYPVQVAYKPGQTVHITAVSDPALKISEGSDPVQVLTPGSD